MKASSGRRPACRKPIIAALAFTILALAAARTQARGLLSSPYLPTQTLVTTTLPIIDITNFLSPVTFTANVISASDAQLLGPSDGVVLFSVAGSNAFSWVPKTVLGSANVSRRSVSGTAQLSMHKDSAGLTLWPGNYNITAEFSGSLNGIYQPSAGSTTFTIRIDSLPVQWGVASAT